MSNVPNIIIVMEYGTDYGRVIGVYSETNEAEAITDAKELASKNTGTFVQVEKHRQRSCQTADKSKRAMRPIAAFLFPSD